MVTVSESAARRPAQALPVLDPPFGACAPSGAQRAVIALARATMLRRGFFRSHVSRMLRLLRPGQIDATFRGASFRLQMDRATTTEWAILLYADYNQAEIDFLAATLGQGGVFLDLGANVGLYSLPLARVVGPKGRVIAIEPDPESLGRLEVNQAASGAANVKIVPVAVGDRNGEARFLHISNLGLSHVADSGTLRVPIRTLASIVAEAGLERVDALKIDIEGFEDRALIPYFGTTKRALWPARIVIEDEKKARWQSDCMEFLARVGYRTVARTRKNALLVLE